MSNNRPRAGLGRGGRGRGAQARRDQARSEARSQERAAQQHEARTRASEGEGHVGPVGPVSGVAPRETPAVPSLRVPDAAHAVDGPRSGVEDRESGGGGSGRGKPVRIERGTLACLVLERWSGADVVTGRVEWTNEQGLTLTTVRHDYPWDPDKMLPPDDMPPQAFEPSGRSVTVYVPWRSITFARLGVPGTDFEKEDPWDPEETTPDIDAWLCEVARPLMLEVVAERTGSRGTAIRP